MTKQDLVSEVARDTKVGIETAELVVSATLEAISRNIKSGNNIYIRGFGTFMRKLRAPKLVRNISAKTTKTLPARYIPALKFSPAITEDMPKP